MRILQVVVRFFPYIGGVENTAYQLSRRLKERGHEVRVICADEPEGSPAKVEGVDVVRLPWQFKIGNTNVCFGLWKALRQEKPDVIHCHLPTAIFVDMAAALSEATGIPLVMTYNNDLVGEGVVGILATAYNRYRLPRVFANCDRIVVTNPLYPSQSPFLDPDDPKVVIIPWGVDPERFRFQEQLPAGPLTVGFLSLLDEYHRYKGLDVLLQALPELPGVRLRVGGAGRELGWYRERAEALGVADRVRFLGFVPDAELNDFYGACHVFVLPSTDGRREGFGLVLLEAMACGRPVITTPIVGVAGDIERWGAGVLVAPNDPGAIAEALRRMNDLPAMGRRARRLVDERYTWDQVADAYEELFGVLIGSSSK
jgi:glycosyltransferase involved in cell wall biosynthesis